jgi:hypothetical protein
LLTTAVGLVADTLAGTGMREPVTMTSASAGCWSAVAAGACCAVADIDRAPAQAHIDKVIMNRFTCDLTLISFRNPIFVSLAVSYLWQRVCRYEDSPLCCRDMKYKQAPL